MPGDDRSATYRSWLRRIELACSILLLAAIVVFASSSPAVLDGVALSIGFVVPGVLGLVALASSGLDVYLHTRSATGPRERSSRWLPIGRLLLTGLIGLLALATLFLVVQTILVVTVVDTGGGVVFGPILWTVTGSALAVAIILRSAGEALLADGTPIDAGRSLR